MALFEPKLAILDETDSGLDIDALKLVAEGVNALRSPDRAMLVITHYQRLLDYIVPDRVHVLAGGPHRRRRRQGTGARARSQGLRADREGRGMNAAASWLDARRAEAREALPRAGRAASPDRGLEIHRSARPRSMPTTVTTAALRVDDRDASGRRRAVRSVERPRLPDWVRAHLGTLPQTARWTRHRSRLRSQRLCACACRAARRSRMPLQSRFRRRRVRRAR